MFLLASRNVYLHLLKVFVDQTRPCIPKVLLLAAMRSSHLFFHSHNRSYAHNYTFLYIVLIHCVLNYSRLRGGNSRLILRSLGMCIAAITMPLRILTHCEIPYLRLVVSLPKICRGACFHFSLCPFPGSPGILWFVIRYFSHTTPSFTCYLVD